MAEAIYLDKEGADGCVKEIERQIEELRESAAAIDGTMGRLREYWKGSSAQKTQTNYEENYKSILTQTIPESVEELKQFVNSCTEAIFETDQQL